MMPEEQAYRWVHTSEIPIRWGDMDAYGHVNNTVYFRYMEQARVEFLDRLGYAIDPRGEAPVLINTSCTFLRPVTYPGRLDVLMFLGAPGRSSIESRYELRLAGDERLLASGAAKIVWIDGATGKSVPIPDSLRRLVDGEGAP